MLPDFPSVKRRADRAFSDFVKREIVRRSPILGEVSRITQHEGHNWSFGPAGQRREGEGYLKLEAEFSLTREEMRQGGMAAVRKRYEEVAEFFAEKQTKDMFAKVSAAADSVGNVVDAGGQFSQEHFIDLFEKVEVDYDPETRRPKNAMFVMHPDTYRKVVPQIKEWEEDAAFQERLKRVHERKWLEWRDRESRRRLVD